MDCAGLGVAPSREPRTDMKGRVGLLQLGIRWCFPLEKAGVEAEREADWHPIL